MNTEISKQWAAELRSGKWKQGRENLCDSEGRHCCLGVLCRMAEEKGVVESHAHFVFVTFGDDLEAGILPEEVREWAGIYNPDGYIRTTGRTLTAINDTGATFAEIADIIEAHAEEL